jgi:hypothetical protein
MRKRIRLLTLAATSLAALAVAPFAEAHGVLHAGGGGGFVGTNGSHGYRAGTTTVNPDGSLTHSGSSAASGSRGSYQSSGDVSRSADGTWSGGRSTSATNASTGVSYSGSTTIDPTTGKPVHTGSCVNAAGETVSCR